jgi:type IV pilus assembly protein PilQ
MRDLQNLRPDDRRIRQSWGNFLIASMYLSAALAGGIFGCSSVAVEEEPGSKVETVTTAQSPQAPTGERPAEAAAPAQDQTLENQPFRIQELQVLEERGQTTVRVQFSRPVSQYRHFPLATPTRIVLDAFGDAQRMAQVENFRVDTHWISGLRLSSSEGYLRLVMDMASGTVPPYLIEQDNGGLKITIGPVNPNFTAKKDVQLVRNGKRSDVRMAAPKAPAPGTKTSASGGVAPPAPAAQGPEVAGDKKYSGQRISLDFKDADIKNVFRLLAEVSGLNIVVTGDVQRRVTLRLVDVPWDQALDLLIDTNGLGKERIGNIVRISTAGQIKSEKDALAAARKAEENLEPLQTAYLSVNYAKVKELVDKIKPSLSPRGSIIPDERSNTLLVRDIKSGIDEANFIVGRLDVRTPQVLIESNLIETTPTFARTLGVNWSLDAPFHDSPGNERRVRLSVPFPAQAPPTGVDFFNVFQNRVGALRNLNATLSAAEAEGNIRVISRPSVVTLNNVASTIQSLRILRVTLPSNTTNVATGTGAAAGAAVATEKINVGVVLTVTPQVSSDGFVLMNINVKTSSIAPTASGSGGAGGAVLPFDELSREAIANILVRDGETIVIGGIMKDTNQNQENGIPYLKDIPIFGWLFKNIRWQKDFEELVVFITPRIVSGGSENLPNAEQLWREQLKKTNDG